MKKCNKCCLTKPYSEFHKAGKYWQPSCKPCLTIYNRKYRKDNPDKIRFNQAKSKLGITKNDFERINKIKSCEICGENKKPLHIDHCHCTGIFRGALCSNCNHAIGKLKDDTQLLKNAIAYLEKYPT